MLAAGIIPRKLLAPYGGMAMLPGKLETAIRSAGYIGAWHVDFTQHKVQANGCVGDYFQVSSKEIMSGINLDALDRAYLPPDLDRVKRLRKSIVSAGGRRDISYRLQDPETGERVPIRSLIDLSVDRFGLLREAKGILLREIEVSPANDTIDYEEALQHVTNSARAMDALGYPHLKTVLQVVFREVARDAILGRDPHKTV